MIKVAVCGYKGRMGSTVVEAVTEADGMEVVCGIDITAENDAPFPTFDTVEKALNNIDADVMVDFTRPDVVENNIKAALPKGVNCVIGTTGLTPEKLEELSKLAKDGACLFYAPNFTIGAVLMMQFSKIAAKYFPQAEVIEFHHCNKLDSPSGTAAQTARMIAQARDGKPSEAPGKETEMDGCEGARGASIDGIPVHSVRSMGFVANQEVIFGSFGQVLTIKHESWDRHSYMPGVILAVRNVVDRSGLIIGLENFLDI